MSTVTDRDRPDTQEMVVIHRIFRRGFGTVAGLARRVPPEDGKWAIAVAGHVEFLLNSLHHHHSAEDQYLWPRLLERTEPDALLIGRMEDQHKLVAGHIDHLRRILPAWRAEPGSPEVADTLGELNRALTAHLEEEEREILPLISSHITAAEWQQMGDASFAKFTNAEKLVALGQMLDVATPDEAATFLGKLPVPVRLLWRITGRRRYAGYMSAVTGPQSVIAAVPDRPKQTGSL